MLFLMEGNKAIGFQQTDYRLKPVCVIPEPTL